MLATYSKLYFSVHRQKPLVKVHANAILSNVLKWDSRDTLFNVSNVIFSIKGTITSAFKTFVDILVCCQNVCSFTTIRTSSTHTKMIMGTMDCIYPLLELIVINLS